MLQKQNHQPVLCPVCGKPMRLASTIPGIGALPELLTFECRACTQAITKARALMSEDAAEQWVEPAE